MQGIKTLIASSVLSCALLVTGCATQTVYVEKPVPYLREPLGIKPPPSLKLNAVTVTMVKPADGDAYIVLSMDDYKDMLLNNKKIQGYILESNSRIESCEAYYTAPIEQQ